MKCALCGEEFAEVLRLAHHVQEHRSKPHQCRECSRMFAQESHLRSHALTKHGKKATKCPQCDRKEDNMLMLRNHLAKEHGAEQVDRYHWCFSCNLLFLTLAEWTAHTDGVHQGVRPGTSLARPNGIRKYVAILVRDEQ
ncbi:PREDICTED: zinc finger protein 771-like [Priapulus caudatus]|uniref:Zinc finger protein 771-like n=1 Tax=Priapulus caudatus TaxID=37621 RepID=A0ABM1EQS9_PRICU|nr:PREDICTED: zinc finger protein 771-like [Priapulus caudatus]